MEESHLFDPWTRDYALLGLRMERLTPGTVDAWIGPAETLAAAHAELGRLLPGSGSLAARWAAWRKSFQAPPERVMPLLDRIAAEARRRTAAHLPLPEGESIELALVRDQPWGAYNWY